MKNERSNVELVQQDSVSSINIEFTDAQKQQFEKAFEVFDVNKDGVISTSEIFEVLCAMGNEVSNARKEKIKAAVSQVDKQNKGCLNKQEFILFMGIMHNYNEEEKRKQEDQSETYGFEAPISSDGHIHEVPYGCCGTVAVAKRPEDMIRAEPLASKLNRLLVALVWLFQFAYVGFILVLIIINYDSYDDPEDWNGMFPKDDKTDNKNGDLLLYIRIINILNWIILLKVMTKCGTVGPDVENFRTWGFDTTFWNRLRYHSRPLFLWNTIANMVYIGSYPGLHTGKVADRGAETVENDYEELILPFVQLITFYFCLSPYWYLSRNAEVVKSKWKMFLSDFFYLNFLRLIFMFFISVIAFVALPFVLILTPFILVSQIMGSNSLKAKGSTAYKIFYALEYLNLETFHSSLGISWGINDS